MGIKVEMEHTTDVRFAAEIAMDHLWEDLNYYQKLSSIEGDSIAEATASDIIKDLDKVKNDLIKKVDVLIAKKKKLYSNIDIESPMSAEEKQLDKDIQSIFSQIQQLIQQKIDDVLNKVGLQNKGFKMTYEMSGGEQQRVDIARAMLNSPKLILADEPTGSLDPETSDEIMQLLFQIAKEDGTAIIMATHDYMVVNKFPARTLTTEGGRLVEKG